MREKGIIIPDLEQGKSIATSAAALVSDAGNERHIQLMAKVNQPLSSSEFNGRVGIDGYQQGLPYYDMDRVALFTPNAQTATTIRVMPIIVANPNFVRFMKPMSVSSEPLFGSLFLPYNEYNYSIYRYDSNTKLRCEIRDLNDVVIFEGSCDLNLGNVEYFVPMVFTNGGLETTTLPAPGFNLIRIDLRNPLQVDRNDGVVSWGGGTNTLFDVRDASKALLLLSFYVPDLALLSKVVIIPEFYAKIKPGDSDYVDRSAYTAMAQKFLSPYRILGPLPPVIIDLQEPGVSRQPGDMECYTAKVIDTCGVEFLTFRISEVVTMDASTDVGCNLTCSTF